LAQIFIHTLYIKKEKSHNCHNFNENKNIFLNLRLKRLRIVNLQKIQ
jgi:hypothetical protein